MKTARCLTIGYLHDLDSGKKKSLNSILAPDGHKPFLFSLRVPKYYLVFILDHDSIDDKKNSLQATSLYHQAEWVHLIFEVFMSELTKDNVMEQYRSYGKFPIF